MLQKTLVKNDANTSATQEFSSRIEAAIRKSQETDRPFLILMVQIANLETYEKRSSAVVTNNLKRELLSAIKNIIHPSQYVGRFQNGVGLVFDVIDVGKVDAIAKRLMTVAQNVVRAGKYNDLSSRWTDIIQQFLMPNKPSIIFPRVGWAIYPRDGGGPKELVQRALNHIIELSR